MTTNQPEAAAHAAAAKPRKPVYKKKRFVIPAAVLVLGIALGSCGGETTNDGAAPEGAATAASSSSESDGGAAPAAEEPAAEEASAEPAGPTVGVPFTADMGGGNTARITIVSAEYTDSVSVEAFAPAAQNGGFLLLDVLWETEKGVTSANPLYFGAKDADGRKGDMYLFADGQLGSGEVLPGDKSRGFVAFDMAPGEATVVVTNPILQEAARIQIAG
ncbi:hypothetical protein [Arthrobacter sp. ZGTC212]|uniref:hypothetical protein n=1 Tax=Arthrobacter sp. ZGTC212 TaxID=2058899 RepID=UPI000CE4426D|nr:hypothetical protein [Arthrobacter sp. ZGTC212]